MGMFDYYKPNEILTCPNCETLLRNWQGKDATCALFVWQEGVAHPIDQPIDEDLRWPLEERDGLRLPNAFVIQSKTCKKHGPALADCSSKDGVWNQTVLRKS